MKNAKYKIINNFNQNCLNLTSIFDDKYYNLIKIMQQNILFIVLVKSY